MTGNRLWMLGVSVAAVVILVFGWLFGISPTLTQAGIAASQAQSTDVQNAAQRAALVKLKRQYDTLPELKKELQKLQISAPESPDLDDFLDQLQALAEANGVTLTAVTAAEATAYGGEAGSTAAPTAPAPTVPAPTSTATPAAGGSPSQSGTGVASTPAPTTDGVFTVPVTVALKGTPEQIMAFIDAAQKGPRFFLVTNSSFTGTKPAEDSTGTLAGFVFVVKDAPAVTTTTK
ncbi:hypothetical protein [Parafrigoribacterium soli]|uniref:hypothetical protein n=1 Tax=Parafrigoribacterium soli TaxID=3144663 RepID=UPI0032F0419E